MPISWKTCTFAAAASLALLAAGLVHGFWTDRWAASVETASAAQRLPALPNKLGDWQGQDLETKSSAPGVAGSLTRRYTNRRLGASVVMALVCGRPGPVATHTPEVCYGASGYVVNDKKAVQLDVEDGPAPFWTSDATRTTVTDETRLRLYWAWNGGQGWVASRDARQEFPRFRHPVLYKLYVLRELTGADLTAPAKGQAKVEPCEAFLQALLPELQQTLFAAP
jgi:hypothetical protein